MLQRPLADGCFHRAVRSINNKVYYKDNSKNKCPGVQNVYLSAFSGTTFSIYSFDQNINVKIKTIISIS